MTTHDKIRIVEVFIGQYWDFVGGIPTWYVTWLSCQHGMFFPAELWMLYFVCRSEKCPFTFTFNMSVRNIHPHTSFFRLFCRKKYRWHYGLIPCASMSCRLFLDVGLSSVRLFWCDINVSLNGAFVSCQWAFLGVHSTPSFIDRMKDFVMRPEKNDHHKINHNIAKNPQYKITRPILKYTVRPQ